MNISNDLQWKSRYIKHGGSQQFCCSKCHEIWINTCALILMTNHWNATNVRENSPILRIQNNNCVCDHSKHVTCQREKNASGSNLGTYLSLSWNCCIIYIFIRLSVSFNLFTRKSTHSNLHWLWKIAKVQYIDMRCSVTRPHHFHTYTYNVLCLIIRFFVIF